MKATKKIRITLGVLTRVEYTEVLAVPAEMTDEQMMALIDARFEAIDGSQYKDDPEYWEAGECYFENVSSSTRINGSANIKNGVFNVTAHVSQ